MLYRRLDTVREQTEKALAGAHARGGPGGTRQARVEREVAADEYARRLAQLNSVERGLCFGRIDLGRIDELGEALYIGRVGLRNEEHETVLVDWRAPAARPFYAATASDPAGLVRRRHLRTRGRTVVGMDDEVFDLTQMSDGDRDTLVGEAALLAALERGRTGRMGDVVATIQTEQDRVIRSGLHGTLVVQGGPGTGKTVAALHRAAYLLYTYRDTLERRGVLVVGPNATFSRYIEQVLPALGETDVVLSSVGELFPGLAATQVDVPGVARIKGDLAMVEAMARAVADRQRVPDGDLEIELGPLTLTVPHAVCVKARKRASRHPHNAGRKLFALDLLRALALDEARRLDAPDDPEDLEYARKLLWQEPQVREAIDALWPALTPYRLVGELFTDPVRLAAAGLSEDLLRPRGAPWTVDDVPLLDEAAELVGEEPQTQAQRTAARRAREEDELYAREVLTITGLEDIDVAAFAEWQHDRGREYLTTASRAAADRGWIYGHVIVDEAQELSAMAWRMVMRRVPTRSMTVVGDLGQTGNAAGARSWGEMLDGYVRWREERLTVNYRTPKEIMDVAADVLREVAPDQKPPRSVRHGEPPHAIRVTPHTLPGVLARLVGTPVDGRLAVITTDERYAEVAALLPEAVTLDPLDSPVAVLTVTRSKGLEFDEVIVVAPEEMAGRELYVAMTRATRRLTVLHEGELPATLRGATRRV
ncbi:HelD family protein [Acrocarpospora phusangensis]|nr:ATP-binding domain-containing protein [Acrocarpospora phusangensis]